MTSRRLVRRSRRSALTGSLLVVFLVVVFLYTHVPSQVGGKSSLPDHQGQSFNSILKQQAKSWRAIFTVILKNDPQCKRPPRFLVKPKLDIEYRAGHTRERPDYLWIDRADVERLQTAHANFVSSIDTSNLHLIYDKGTRGIVMTVSDTQIPVLLVSLRMIRKTGSSLPVEVFLWQSTPYTTPLCQHILPSLDTRCIFLHDIFTEASTGVPLETYQFKIFAILFSSFDEILLLDSDAFPTSNPDQLFRSKPFRETGLVLWPDFWYASESHYFFRIAGIPPRAVTNNPAIEAGQLMYAKSRHEKSIILSAYYNYHGPEYYYPLQSQGGPGQGDKETFGLAALALGEPQYTVETPVIALGRKDSSGEFRGSAMIQHMEVHVKSDLLDDLSTSTDRPGVAKAMFIHANFPKFDVRTIFDKFNGGTPTRDTNGTRVRCWDVEPGIFEVDIERRLWGVLETVACDDLLGPQSVEQIKDGKLGKEEKVCDNVRQHVRAVFSPTD